MVGYLGATEESVSLMGGGGEVGEGGGRERCLGNRNTLSYRHRTTLWKQLEIQKFARIVSTVKCVKKSEETMETYQSALPH